MTEEEIQKIISNQHEFFRSGKTLDVGFRRAKLKALYNAINARLEEIHEGIYKDLGKSADESYMCETGLVLNEIRHQIKHLGKYAAPRRARTPLAHFAAKSYVLPSPFGTVLIMNPWNYPFLLSMDPLVEAVAAGNTAVLKLSSYSPNSNSAIKKVVESVFDRGHVDVVFGGSKENAALIESKFDYIFFTGSKRVGTIVLQKAAERLTPVTLELGGKSPCVVDETANIPLAAKRIVWGKFLNLGQTCVAPDYILCHESVAETLTEELKKQIKRQFGDDPISSPNYGKMINQKHFDRVSALIDPNKVVFGGRTNAEKLKIEPTIMAGVTGDDAVMREEIFGPVLPILTYREESEITNFVTERDAPLAFYIFSTNKRRIARLTRTLGFGGGCVNDVVIHLATPNMPFGGFGASGMGAYHGKTGFDGFSHLKSIVDKKNVVDLPMRYQPYTKSKRKIIKTFLH